MDNSRTVIFIAVKLTGRSLAIIRTGQSNLTTGRNAAAHERFSGIRHDVPVYTPPNTCFRGSTRVQIPNSISIASAFLRVVSCRTAEVISISAFTCPTLDLRSAATSEVYVGLELEGRLTELLSYVCMM